MHELVPDISDKMHKLFQFQTLAQVYIADNNVTNSSLFCAAVSLLTSLCELQYRNYNFSAESDLKTFSEILNPTKQTVDTTAQKLNFK